MSEFGSIRVVILVYTGRTALEQIVSSQNNKIILNRCRYFFLVFLFFCSEICQVNNYKRRALYLLIVKSGTL